MCFLGKYLYKINSLKKSTDTGQFDIWQFTYN